MHPSTGSFSPLAIAEGADSALLQLGKYLRDRDYRFTTITPLSHQHNNRRPQARLAENLRDVFGWSRPFELSLLSETERELMLEADVLQTHGEHWQSSVRWSSLDDLLLVHSAYPTEASDAVFFGPDTYRFAQAIKAFVQANGRNIQRAVDIGCGSGAGAILLGQAYPGAQVLAVDINPQALRLTAINAQLARTANLRPLYSDLLTDVLGDFDLIIANPPYMLDPQERAYRHGGGAFGASLSMQIVETALSRLTPGGTLLLYTGVAMIAGRDPFLDRLQQYLKDLPCSWEYREVDPDVFGEELLKPDYSQVERIAAVVLTLIKHSNGRL